MKRQFASTELYALENEALAIQNAIETLKERLLAAPESVANDVLGRCDPAVHRDLIDWIETECTPRSSRLPREWSPKRNTGIWLLYQAANLSCPINPPRR